MVFTENLRQRRLEQFLTQAELSRRATQHPLTIARLEVCVTAPSTRTVRALAKALGVEPRELATPDEVAEQRRVLEQAKLQTSGGSDHLDYRSDDGLAAPARTGAQSAKPGTEIAELD
jgi:transcriptional regulator with XRE-family HTH domain